MPGTMPVHIHGRYIYSFVKCNEIQGACFHVQGKCSIWKSDLLWFPFGGVWPSCRCERMRSVASSTQIPSGVRYRCKRKTEIITLVQSPSNYCICSTMIIAVWNAQLGRKQVTLYLRHRVTLVRSTELSQLLWSYTVIENFLPLLFAGLLADCRGTKQMWQVTFNLPSLASEEFEFHKGGWVRTVSSSSKPAPWLLWRKRKKDMKLKYNSYLRKVQSAQDSWPVHKHVVKVIELLSWSRRHELDMRRQGKCGDWYNLLLFS